MLEPHVFDRQSREYVRAIALRIVKNPADADDVAQDALVLAFRYRDSFRGESRYSTWLHRITQTAALMYLRKRRRYWREIPESASGDDAQERTTQLARASTPATALSDLDCREQLEHTRQIVERLGERYPEVFWRRYGQGFTETEIAADLGLSLATVKTRAHRAKLAVTAGAQQRAAA